MRQVARGASSSIIKKQYRKLCLVYHPDKSQHPDASEAFIAITQAYEKVKNGGR